MAFLDDWKCAVFSMWTVLPEASSLGHDRHKQSTGSATETSRSKMYRSTSWVFKWCCHACATGPQEVIVFVGKLTLCRPRHIRSRVIMLCG